VSALPAELVAFATLFNRGEFWESHEVLEASWRENRSDFYQGLIILASAFVHAQRGNVHGVCAQLDKAIRYLEPYQPNHMGLEVERLLQQAEQTRESVVSGEPVQFPRIPLDPDEPRARSKLT
jgi:predicted metal-dependent hydrolase